MRMAEEASKTACVEKGELEYVNGQYWNMLKCLTVEKYKESNT